MDATTHEVFTFAKPHRVGSICSGSNCDQCGDAEYCTTDSLCRPVPDTPMAILAEATKEDWEQAIRQDGGVPGYNHPYFYFVSVD